MSAEFSRAGVARLKARTAVSLRTATTLHYENIKGGHRSAMPLPGDHIHAATGASARVNVPAMTEGMYGRRRSTALPRWREDGHAGVSTRGDVPTLTHLRFWSWNSSGDRDVAFGEVDPGDDSGNH